MTHLIAKNHEQHNNVRVVEVAEIIGRVAAKRVKDGLDSFSALSYKAFQFTFPAERASWKTFGMQFEAKYFRGRRFSPKPHKEVTVLRK